MIENGGVITVALDFKSIKLQQYKYNTIKSNDVLICVSLLVTFATKYIEVLGCNMKVLKTGI